MIGYLQGKPLQVKPTQVIIDVNGVGYVVQIPISVYEEIQAANVAALFIHTHVREDAIQLFGFSKESDKEMFELLISVNGIGPKTALGVLSGIRTDDLRTAILRGDINRIVAAPGIGKKTAERLILELKGKIESLSTQASDTNYTIRGEGIAALVSLGYNQKLAEKIIRELLDEQPAITLEDLLRQCLKRLSQ